MANPKRRRMPNPVGRPTKYKEEYCDMLIRHMESGLSFDSFAAVIKVNRDSLYEWVKVHPEFSDAQKEAYSQNLLFWEKIGISGMVGRIPDFNATVWIFNMKNRHGWRDKQDVDHTGVIQLQRLSPEEIETRIQKALDYLKDE